MDNSNASNRDKCEECIAHVIWAAHILHYLVGERSQTRLLPELDHEEDFDGDELDALTENEVILTSSGDSVRFKLLDCVAELVSPSKGWDHVITTGLRESTDSIEIDITRNDGFGMSGGLKGGKFHAKAADMQYFVHLQKYLASASVESVSDLSLNWFDSVAIEYNHERIDHWTAIARKYIALLPAIQDQEGDCSPGFQQAAKTWTNITKLLSHRGTGETIRRGQVVHAAYLCIISIEVRELLQTTFSVQIGSKLWRILRFIARPVSNCHLLMRIASRLPHFRKVKICPLPSGPKTKLSRKYLVDITDAWSRLGPISALGSEPKTLAAFKSRFRQDCARAFSTHSEVQLFLHYEHNVSLTPSIDYFGCSKKSCLLCEGFLQALSRPISTRGRHGICYPSWAVPLTRSEDVLVALQQLEKTLVDRIEKHMKSPPANTFLNQVPQSTIASDFPNSSLEEILRKKGMMKSVEEKRQILQRQRNILEGQVSKSGSTSSLTPVIQPYDSCVMCNKSPAKLCARCKSCHYCSRECQESDWTCHKILCKEMSILSPRPSPAHRLAIFFPETGVKPLLTWVLCYRKASSEYERYGITVEYETANVRPLLGKDNPVIGQIYIEYNPKRDKSLGSGMAAMSFTKGGYSIELTIREAFLIDGSTINRSIMESVKTSGTVCHRWCGPIVAMRSTCKEFYEDITLADFRHIIDYFVTYNTVEVREITNPESYIRRPRVIHGVKICCYGEIKLHGADPYIPVEVPMVHPICRTHREGDISPISKLLGRALRLWKFPDIESWIDPPGWDENLLATSNPDAAFLMMGADPRSEDWGWAPPYWNNDIGNVLAVCDDGSDLSVDELRLTCHFVRQKLLPMFEDSMGIGLVSRTKQEVLNFITRENMEKYKGELQMSQSAFS